MKQHSHNSAPSHTACSNPPVAGLLMRKCACGTHTGGGECPECRKKRGEATLQRWTSHSTKSTAVPQIVHDVLRSPGEPLDPAIQASFGLPVATDLSAVQARGPAIGMNRRELTMGPAGDAFEEEADRVAERVRPRATPVLTEIPVQTRLDLSHVQIHTDDLAAQSARAVHARAYTVGRDVVFGQSEYRPETTEGKRLLAHELTHVMQQTGAGSSASPSDRLQRQNQESEPTPAAPGPSGGPSTSAPEFGPIEFDPECPRNPTRLGKLPPEPACPEAEDDIDGEQFRFCRDTDVFRDQAEPALLRIFARNQSSLAFFKVYGYASTEGPAKSNLNLSCHRAKRVARELINAGVRSEHIQIAAKGETDRFSKGNTEKQLAPNRVVVVEVEVPPLPAPPKGPLPTDRRQLVDLAIERLERGDYRLAADAYISFWSCGFVPNLREAVRRTRIEIEDKPCPVIPGKSLGFPIKFNPSHPLTLNAIQLSADSFCAADPLECILARIIDMSFHHMTRRQIPDIDANHAPALFLVELAGISPCQTSDGQPFWNRVTRDPMQAKPDPPCAVAPLPGPLVSPQGQGRAPRVTPVFNVDQAGFQGRRGPITWTPLGGAARMEPSQQAFSLKSQVTLTGDPREFRNYEIGYIQTVIQNEETAEYVSGHRVNFLLPVPIRDGPPASLGFATPPWFDARFIGVPDAASGVASTHMSDSPSRVAPLEFFEKNDVLSHMEQHLVFNNWLVARRKGAPLDRFNTFFLDGTLIDFRQEADVVGPQGTGTFDTRVDVSTDQESMQLSGPTPADVPQNLQLTFKEPPPRQAAGGKSFADFAAAVNQIAEPHRRRLGLLRSMTARIRIVPSTGHVVLDAPDLHGGTIKITTNEQGISAASLQELARAIFPETRKLVVAPIPRGETLQEIPIVLRVLPP